MAKQQRQRSEVRDLQTGDVTPIQTTYNRVTDAYMQPQMANVARPAEDPSGLMAVSVSLAQFQPRLQEFVNQYTKVQNEKDEAEGARQYMDKRDNADYVKRIKMGELQPGESPYLMRGAQIQHMHDQVARFNLETMTAIQKDKTLLDPENPNAPAQFEQFMQNRHKEFFDQTAYKIVTNADGTTQRLKLFDSRDIERVMLPGMSAVENQARSMFTAQSGQVRSQYVKEKALNGLYSILETNAQDIAEGDLTKLSLIGQKMNDVFYNPIHGLVKLGYNPTEANNQMVDAVVNKAVENHDLTWLKLLDTVSTKDGRAYLGDTAYAKANRTVATDKVLEWHHKMQMWREHDVDRVWTMQEREHTTVTWQRQEEAHTRLLKDQAKTDENDFKKRQSDLFQSDWLVGIQLKQMGAPLEDSVESQNTTRAKNWLQRNDPDAYRTMVAFETAARSRRVEDRKESAQGKAAYLHILETMTNNPKAFSTAMISSGATQGFFSMDDAKSFYSAWRTIRENTDHPYMQNPVYKTLLNDLEKSIIGNEFEAKEDQRIRAMDAKFQAHRAAAQWIEDHPKATQDDFESFVHKTVDPLIQQGNPSLGDKKTQMLAEQRAGQKPVDPKEVPDTRSFFDFTSPDPKEKARENVAAYRKKVDEIASDEVTKVDAAVKPEQLDRLDRVAGAFVSGQIDEKRLKDEIRNAYEPYFYANDWTLKRIEQFVNQKASAALDERKRRGATKP